MLSLCRQSYRVYPPEYTAPKNETPGRRCMHSMEKGKGLRIYECRWDDYDGRNELY